MLIKLAGTALAAVLALTLAGEPAPAADQLGTLLPLAPMGDDGLYKQNWMPETFLDFAEDLTEAAAQGKRLALIWEQKGCPYCKETHLINFRHPELVDYIKANFVVIQMNIWGDREVGDFDGETLTEKDFARKYNILFTPTIQFFPATLEEIGGRAGPRVEVFRLPGYFRNFHMLNAFRFVKEDRYRTQNFQRYILEKAAEARRN